MDDLEPELSKSPHWLYLAPAAVLTDFSAEKLRPLGGGEPDIALVGMMLMEHGEPLRIGPAKGRWSLCKASRVAALAELKQTGELSKAIECNRHGDRPDNTTQRSLDTLLQGDPIPPLAEQSLPELLGLDAAIEMLGPTLGKLPVSHKQVIAQIERLRLLEPLQRLLAHGFAGRKTQMETLRAYVDELESESFKEMLSRKLDNVLDIFRTRPLLAIWGPGGAGKSTLIAKFLLDHAGPQQARPTPFLYLDFDRNQLDPIQPDSLLADALRQIKVQFPDFAEKATGLAADTATRLMSEDSSEISRSLHFEQSSQLREQFSSLVGEISKANGSKVLFFVDTFEVVQRRGPTYAYSVLKLIAQLVQASPMLRPVVVGRSALRNSDFSLFSDSIPRWKSLSLEGFDAEAGRLYLQDRLNKLDMAQVNATILDRIVTLTGGNPLSLRLAAQVFAKSGITSLEDAVDEAEFDAAFTQERLQGMLHNRIVSALDEPVRLIADPGLIVRRLTPEVILHVLAKPCGLAISTLTEAEKIFNRLSNEVSLFESTSSQVLRHRPDVRFLMLPLLRYKLGSHAREIDEIAIRFWSDQDSSEARAEQIYHLLWLEGDFSALETAWSTGPVSKPLLEEALDEFNALEGSVSARIWLSGKLQREISSDLESQANLAEWERHAEQRIRRLLASGLPQEALSTLRAREERTTASPLWLLEIETLKLMGRDDEAMLLVERALKLASGSRNPTHVLSLLLHKTWLLERSSQIKDAFRYASKAVRLATVLGDETRQFEAKLTQARLARVLMSEDTAKLQLELARMSDSPAIKFVFDKRPVLLSEAVAEIGALRPELFIALSKLAGSGRTDRRGEANSLITTGVALAESKDLRKAVETLEKALAIGLELNDDAIQARALLQLSSVHLEHGDLAKATESAGQALSFAQALGNADIKSQALNSIGSAKLMAADMPGAIAAYSESLKLARKTGNRPGESAALGNLAHSFLETGQLDQAIQLLEQDLGIARELLDRQSENQALDSLATAYWRKGDRKQAIDLYNMSLELASSLGDQRSQSVALNSLGTSYADLQQWERAEEYLTKALAISSSIGDFRNQFVANQNLASLYERTDRLVDAHKHLNNALSLSQATGNHIAAFNALDNLGNLYYQLGRLGDAHDCFAKQLDIAEKVSNPNWVGIALSNQARALSDFGDSEAAAQKFDNAQTLLPENPSPTLGAILQDSEASTPTVGETFNKEIRTGRYSEVLVSLERTRDDNTRLFQQMLS